MITDERFIPLSIPVPPMLEEVLGYPGRLQRPDDKPAQYCAFYWTNGGDEASFHDGRRSAVGMMNNEAYLAFVRHRAVAPHLHGYNLGSSEDEADYWLVLDRNERKLYLAPVEAAGQLLVQQWGPPRPAVSLRVANQEELRRLLLDMLNMDSWTEVTSTGNTQQVMLAMRAEWEQVQEMITWLDSFN